jgi:hypothetical protein
VYMGTGAVSHTIIVPIHPLTPSLNPSHHNNNPPPLSSHPPPPKNIRFREKGVSDRLYREAFEPMLLGACMNESLTQSANADVLCPALGSSCWLDPFCLFVFVEAGYFSFTHRQPTTPTPHNHNTTTPPSHNTTTPHHPRFLSMTVGLFAPGEQCSAAGALGMLYFFILAVRRCFLYIYIYMGGG